MIFEPGYYVSPDGVEHWTIRSRYRYRSKVNRFGNIDPVIRVWVNWCEEQLGTRLSGWSYYRYTFDFLNKNDYILFLLTWDQE
jgi:hypothetical protein